MLRPLLAGLTGLALTTVLAVPATAATTEQPPMALALQSSVITAGQATSATGTAAPGQGVELWGYSRPSLTYSRVASSVADDAGAFSFALAPPTNSRYFVQSPEGDGDSASVALSVRSAVSLAVQRVDGATLVFSGTVVPATTGALVQIVAERGGERRVEAQGRTSRGRFRITDTGGRFGGFLVSARTTGSLDNVAGESDQQRVVLAPRSGGATHLP